MDRSSTDPAKLLASWMEWEKGDTTPGTLLEELKVSGLREQLQVLAAESRG